MQNILRLVTDFVIPKITSRQITLPQISYENLSVGWVGLRRESIPSLVRVNGGIVKSILKIPRAIYGVAARVSELPQNSFNLESSRLAQVIPCTPTSLSVRVCVYQLEMCIFITSLPVRIKLRAVHIQSGLSVQLQIVLHPRPLHGSHYLVVSPSVLVAVQTQTAQLAALSARLTVV